MLGGGRTARAPGQSGLDCGRRGAGELRHPCLRPGWQKGCTGSPTAPFPKEDCQRGSAGGTPQLTQNPTPPTPAGSSPVLVVPKQEAQRRGESPGKSSGGLSFLGNPPSEGRGLALGGFQTPDFPKKKSGTSSRGGAPLVLEGRVGTKPVRTTTERTGREGGGLPFVQKARADGSLRLSRQSTISEGFRGKQAGKVVCSVWITKTWK